MNVSLYLDKETLDKKKHTVLSYGAGTQSTALLLLALNNELHTKPDISIFADTGGEPDHVYEFLFFIKDYVKKEYNHNIKIIKTNNIVKDMKAGVIHAPIFSRLNDANDKQGMLNRQCTYIYKVAPINKFLRKHFKIRYKNIDQTNIIEQWIGLSFDEIQRMKISNEYYYYNRYPLIEKEFKRIDSIKYIKSFGLPDPPRSSCYFCPFHTNKYWKYLKHNYPSDFNKAIDIDNIIRNINPKMKNFIHKTFTPLKDIDLKTNKELGILELFEDGLNNDCSGYCGV